MAIPQNVSDVINKDFHISISPDMQEIEAWLALLPSAMQSVYSEYIKKKNDADKAQEEYDIAYSKELLLTDKTLNVTVRKEVAKEALVEKRKAVTKAKNEVRIAEVNVRMIEECSGSVRKLANIRNNMQFNEDGFTSKGQGNNSVPQNNNYSSPGYNNPQQNNSNFYQQNNGYQDNSQNNPQQQNNFGNNQQQNGFGNDQQQNNNNFGAPNQF